MKIAVCWKWVSLDSDSEADPRWSGVSGADEAALELALTIAERAPSSEVMVISLGPPSADDVLREALAVGASAVTRINASTQLDSRAVAVALAQHLAGYDLVLCGDYSLDRGTGSVPAFLAGELASAQALGLLEVHPASDGRTNALRVLRRLDGGRREILEVTAPAVLSVEGSAASLRRAALAASLDARSAAITVVAGPHGHMQEAEIHPYRPRARVLPAPAGAALDRVRQVLDVGGGDSHAELLTLDPPSAAARIVDQLREWGYLETGEAPAPG